MPYTNQAGALIDAVRAVGEQLIAANPVGMRLVSLFQFANLVEQGSEERTRLGFRNISPNAYLLCRACCG